MNHTFKGMTLSKLQEKHLSAVRWLIADGPKCSGRSFLMAMCFIEKAIRHPGRSINFFDHDRSVSGKNNIRLVVEIILSRNPKIHDRCVLGRDWLRVDKQNEEVK